MNAKNCLLAKQTLPMIGVTAENRSQQFSARTLVICIVCQTGKQFSAVTPVIAKVFQTGKRFSAVTPIICKVC
jgi:hypothetical protein